MMLADFWSMPVPITVLLAVVALLGYLVGLRNRAPASRSRANTRHEILRALAVAQELETIAYRLRKSMTFHVPAFAAWKLW